MIFLILSTIFFGIALIFVKLSTVKIYPLLGNLIFLSSAFIVQLGAIIYVKLKGIDLTYTSEGIILSLIGGIFIGLYTIFLFLTFSQFDITKASPIIYIGAISIAVIIGAIFLKEPLTLYNILGLVLAFVGLFLLFWR